MGTWRIGLIALAALAAEADTVTTRDSRSWNGNLVSIQGGVLELQATFPKGPATLRFGADYIRAIEFNMATYNPGAIPKLPALPAARSGTLSGTVYARPKKTQKPQDPPTCKDIATSDSKHPDPKPPDPKHLYCDGKDIGIVGKDVVRMLIDTK